jgi:hypothetical protein
MVKVPAPFLLFAFRFPFHMWYCIASPRLHSWFLCCSLHHFSILASFQLLYSPHLTTIISFSICMCYVSLPWLCVELSLFLSHDLYIPDSHRYCLQVLPPVTSYFSPLHQSCMYVYKPMSWLPHRHLENLLDNRGLRSDHVYLQEVNRES